ncbi:MAG: DUF433 domain-containing protein, partial [Bacteroidota bacterium]
LFPIFVSQSKSIDMTNYPHLERRADILGGKPVIKGTRISVAMILEWMASGGHVDSIAERYPQLSKEAIQEAVRYASEELGSVEIIEVTVAA